MSGKLNTLFPSAAKSFAKASDVRSKDELIISSIDVFPKALDRGITPK